MKYYPLVLMRKEQPICYLRKQSECSISSTCQKIYIETLSAHGGRLRVDDVLFSIESKEKMLFISKFGKGDWCIEHYSTRTIVKIISLDGHFEHRFDIPDFRMVCGGYELIRKSPILLDAEFSLFIKEVEEKPSPYSRG